MQSLLGKFYTKIKGSQEDIASESLVYILKNSSDARKIIKQLIERETALHFSELTYTTQNVGENLERPDISGVDNNGEEVLLIEAKFWSALTKNQPNTYLERMGNDAVLIFLTPTLRVRVVFEEVLHKIKDVDNDIDVDMANLKIRKIKNNQFILVKSWDEILQSIKSALVKTENQNVVSDIDQIIGLCDAIDKNSFQPISSTDLSPEIPKKLNSYYDIVDKVVDETKNRLRKVSTKGLVRTPQRYGYCRYFLLDGLGMGMSLRMDLWSEYSDTPFWIIMSEIDKNAHWHITKKFKNKCENIGGALGLTCIEKNGVMCLGLYPKIDETEDVVISDLTNQIEKIYQELKK